MTRKGSGEIRRLGRQLDGQDVEANRSATLMSPSADGNVTAAEAKEEDKQSVGDWRPDSISRRLGVYIVEAVRPRNWPIV